MPREVPQQAPSVSFGPQMPRELNRRDAQNRCNAQTGVTPRPA